MISHQFRPACGRASLNRVHKPGWSAWESAMRGLHAAEVLLEEGRSMLQQCRGGDAPVLWNAGRHKNPAGPLTRPPT